MKLIVCAECNDMFNLDKHIKKCSCGKSKGVYLEDGVHALFSGPAVPLGIRNSEFFNAVYQQPEKGQGPEFTGWVMPVLCETFKATTDEFLSDLESFDSSHFESAPYSDMLWHHSIHHNGRRSIKMDRKRENFTSF